VFQREDDTLVKHDLPKRGRVIFFAPDETRRHGDGG
jgi:hypothetical protein